MSDREPEHNESTDEEVWKDLVARLEEMDDGGPAAPDAGPAAPGPEAPSAPEVPAAPAAPAAAPDAGTPAERTRALFRNQPPAGGPRDYTAPEDNGEEGGFVPPEPPPLGTGEPLVVLAWIGAIGGPLLLLVFAMLWRSAPLAVVLGTIAVFVGSAAYLLFRLPQYRDEGDDGAAV